MHRPKPSRRQMESLCAEIHAEDGSDPKTFFKAHRTGGAANRKTLQLCSQVAETLALVLAGECHDDVLRNLQVLSVRPGADASYLLVFVAPSLEDQAHDPAEILSRLESYSGRLRAEIATAITRKRTPRLIFQVLPAQAAEGGLQ